MPLHPQIVEVLKAMERAQLRPLESLTPVEARTQMEATAKARNANPTAVGRVEERLIPGPHGEIRLRLYWPEASQGRLPMVVYFHGGGHVIGSLDTHDGTARNLCAAAGVVLVSVDYRMGPEHRFPAAVDDSWAALKWVHANADALGGDPDRLAVAGDSAGGNLAAVVAIMARDAGGPALRLQALVYPLADYALVDESYKKYGEGYGILTAGAMAWFRDHYLNGIADAADWRASPIKAKSLAGVAPAVVVAAELDVLRDEGVRYADALREAGVSVERREYPGMIHAFFGMAPIVNGSVEAQRFVADALRDALA